MKAVDEKNTDLTWSKFQRYLLSCKDSDARQSKDLRLADFQEPRGDHPRRASGVAEKSCGWKNVVMRKVPQQMLVRWHANVAETRDYAVE